MVRIRVVFAGAGRADDADHLPVLHLQIDAFQHLMLTPGFANAPQIRALAARR
ncbi:Uncharacterised protein [Klebsiella pneumoniae]|nr:Uncharacterised protein [Klebsiella pneumoniae]